MKEASDQEKNSCGQGGQSKARARRKASKKAELIQKKKFLLINLSCFIDFFGESIIKNRHTGLSVQMEI